MGPSVSEGLHFFFFKVFKTFLLLLFLESEEGRKKERERSINVWLPLTCPPSHWGSSPQPRDVSWLGIEPATLGFAGWLSIHWVTPARAGGLHFFWPLSLAIKDFPAPPTSDSLSNPLLNFKSPGLSLPCLLPTTVKQTNKQNKQKTLLNPKCQSSSAHLRKRPLTINEPCSKICHFPANFSKKHHPVKKSFLNANLVMARITQCSDLLSSHFGIGCISQEGGINSWREHGLKHRGINKLPVMDMQMEQEQIFKQPYLCLLLPCLVQNS